MKSNTRHPAGKVLAASRVAISEAIAREAITEPFTMPFFLAGELVKECKRQGLRNMQYKGPGYRVEVKIVIARERGVCSVCGKSVALTKHGARTHRNRHGEWCTGSQHAPTA